MLINVLTIYLCWWDLEVGGFKLNSPIFWVFGVAFLYYVSIVLKVQVLKYSMVKLF